MKMERPSFNPFVSQKTMLLEEKRQKIMQKSKPMNFDFNMRAYYLNFYIFTPK
jgi:hypothetical protein